VKGGRFWIGLVVAMLVANAAAMFFLIAEAGDPTPRVLPDYYKKAVAWDETAAARRASAALGWTAAIEVDAATLRVRLADPTGGPVTGARVTIAGRQRSRADQPYAVELVESSPGRYAGVLPPAPRGLHELELTADRGAETFLSTTVIER
jgi:nitrogen fixation protein FixH